jgi:hypothetical protein
LRLVGNLAGNLPYCRVARWFQDGLTAHLVTPQMSTLGTGWLRWVTKKTVSSDSLLGCDSAGRGSARLRSLLHYSSALTFSRIRGNWLASRLLTFPPPGRPANCSTLGSGSMSNKRRERVAESIQWRDAAKLRSLAVDADTNQERMVLMLIADLIEEQTARTGEGTDTSCRAPGAEAAD